MQRWQNDPRAYIKSCINPSEPGIEIGGGYNPLISKKEGYAVFTIDHLTQEQLIEKYKNDEYAAQFLENIEHVDAVDDGREFRELLDLPKGAEYIISIHNFEHITNPIRFLQRCEHALSDTGKLYLVIPDRRGTFDYYRPYSTIGQWMEAYKDNHTIHTFAALYDYLSYPVMGNGDYGSVDFMRSPEEARQLVLQQYRPDEYADAHGFVYTPSSFLFLLSHVRQIGLTSLGVEEMITTPNSHFQFLAVLSKRGGMELPLKQYAIDMVGENINYRRAFNDAPPPPPPPVPLRRQVYDRFRASHPMAARALHPFAKLMWRVYTLFR